MKIRLLVYGLLLAVIAALPYTYYKASVATVKIQVMNDVRYIEGNEAMITCQVVDRVRQGDVFAPLIGGLITFQYEYQKAYIEAFLDYVLHTKVPYKVMFKYFYFGIKQT